MKTKQQVVILGGGYAGLMAAARLGGDKTLDVTLVDARPAFLQRIRFHEMLAGGEPYSLDYAPLLAKRNVRFIQGRIESLDPAGQRVSGSAGGAGFELGYDAAILALGSSTPAGAAGVERHALRLDEPAAIRAAHGRLAELAARGGRALIVGGGLTGIETATELAERFRGLKVTLATSGALGRDYVAGAQAHLRAVFARLGIELREQTRIAAVEERQALTDGGDALPFDLCVWTAGFRAAPLAQAAGLEVDALGRAYVDATLRTPRYPTLLVAGDSAAAKGSIALPDGAALRMSCAAGMPMGAYAAASARGLLHGAPVAPLSLGFAGRCVSLGRREALLQFVESDDTPRAAFWTGRRAVWAKELICRATGAAIKAEFKGWPLFRWVAGPKAAAQAAATYEM